MVYTPSRNQGFTHVILIIVGVILSAILIGLFTYSNKGKTGQSLPADNTPSSSDNNAPAVYPNLPTSPLPAGCTDTSSYSTTTGEPCNTASAHIACGLTVVTPSATSPVGQSFQVSGWANGCGWGAFEGQAGTVQAYKSDGTAVSNRIPLNVAGNWMQEKVYFQTGVTLNQLQASGSKGYLLFRNEDPSGQKPLTSTFFIKF